MSTRFYTKDHDSFIAATVEPTQVALNAIDEPQLRDAVIQAVVMKEVVTDPFRMWVDDWKKNIVPGRYRFLGADIDIRISPSATVSYMVHIYVRAPSIKVFDAIAQMIFVPDFRTGQFEEVLMSAPPMARKPLSDRRATKREIKRVLRTMPIRRQLQSA